MLNLIERLEFELDEDDVTAHLVDFSVTATTTKQVV